MKTMKECRIKLSAVFGMDVDARSALWQLEELAQEGSVGVPGRFMPDPQISKRLASIGVVEEAEEA